MSDNKRKIEDDKDNKIIKKKKILTEETKSDKFLQLDEYHSFFVFVARVCISFVFVYLWLVLAVLICTCSDCIDLCSS